MTDKTRSARVGRRPSAGRSSADDRLSAAVGSIFRQAREAQRLSQQQVAEMTSGLPGKVSRTTISAIECGRSLPGLETLVSMSRVLHLDATEVLERVDLSLKTTLDLTGVTHDELRRRAEKYFWAADYRSALAVYNAMFERLLLDPPEDPRERDRLQARIEVNRAVTLRQCSALKAARAAVERALELARDHPSQQAEAYMVLASIHSHEGKSELAFHMADLATQLAESGDAKLRGQAWSQKGNVLNRIGKYEEARQAFLHARKFILEAGGVHELIRAEGNIGTCLMELGRLAQARGRFVRAVNLAREHEDRSQESFWLIELGRLALKEDDVAEADRCAEAALRIAEPVAGHLTIFRAEWLRHQVVLKTDPEADDGRRLRRLKKLYARVREHRTFDPVREFRELVLEAEHVPEEDAHE